MNSSDQEPVIPSKAPPTLQEVVPPKMKPLPKPIQTLNTLFKWGLLLSLPLLFVEGLGLYTGTFCCIGLAVIFALFRIQARLIEVMVTTAVGSIPMGLILSVEVDHGEVAIMFILSIFGMFLIFLGSLWGFSAAQRLGEERTFRRLGLMCIGWCMMYAILSGIACLFLVDKLLRQGSIVKAWLVGIGLGTAVFIGAAGLIMELRLTERGKKAEL